MSTPQQAPIVSSLKDRKIFVTHENVGEDEGNISPVDLLGAINAKHFGAIGDGVTDDTDALNDAANAARETRYNALVIPATSDFYLISATLNFTGIKIIDGRGALIKTAMTGASAVKIGDGVTQGCIHLEVRHLTQGVSVAGSHAVHALKLSNSTVNIYARDFLTGLYIDGRTTAQGTVGNRFFISKLYNNLRQVHIDLAHNSYFIGNHFYGGGYYYGAAAPVAGVPAGTFYLQLEEDSRIQDVVVYDSEIGIDMPSVDDTEHAVLVYADISTSVNDNAFDFSNARVELYGAQPNTPLGVHINTTTSGKLAVRATFTNCNAKLSTRIPDGARNVVEMSAPQNRQSGGFFDPAFYLLPSPSKVVTSSGRAYIPNRMLRHFSAGLMNYHDNGVTAGSSKSIDGREHYTSSTHVSFGRKFVKPVGSALYGRLLSGREPFAIICYDTDGSVLSGNEPQYASGTNNLQTSYGVDFYRMEGSSFFIHPNVASFYIGSTPWLSSGLVKDLEFEVTFGPKLQEDFSEYTGADLVLNTYPRELGHQDREAEIWRRMPK